MMPNVSHYAALNRLQAVARDVLDGKAPSVRRAIFEWDEHDLLEIAVAHGEEMVSALRRSRTLEIERRDAPTPPPRDRRPLRERLDPEARARHDEKMDEIERRRDTRLREIIEDYAESMKARWTAELLDSEIAMPDGTVTTWGEATADQHRERYEMHERNARAGIEGAARHRYAIADLERTGAPNLNALAREAAAV